MELKFSVLFGVIFAIVLLVVTTAVFMVYPAYVDIAAIITIVILAPLLTKMYLARVKASMSGMIATAIVWIVITAIFDLAYASALGLNLVAYYSNYMIYVGYLLLIIFVLVRYKTLSRKEAKPPETQAK